MTWVDPKEVELLHLLADSGDAVCGISKNKYTFPIHELKFHVTAGVKKLCGSCRDIALLTMMDYLRHR